MVWGSNSGGDKIFWNQPDQPWGPTSLLYNEYRVCFLEMNWPGCGADHPPLLVLRSCIQRGILLLPLCACLACNGTAFTFIHIQIPYNAHNNNHTRTSKDICSGSQTAWSGIDMCNISLKLYKGFQCHSQNVCLFYRPTQPSHLLCNSRHIMTILLPSCLQIHLQSPYHLLFHIQSSP